MYTYCENDPIQYVDPSGHTTDWEIDWFMGKQGDPSEYKNGMRVTKSSSSSSGSTVTLSDVADATTWSKGSSKATFSFNGTQQDLYVENGKAYDSWGNVRGTIENGHIIVTNKDFNSMFGNSTGSVSNSTTVNVKQGDHVTSASTYAGSNVTINNYGIMDTITTGKNSSLVLNNYGKISNEVNIGEGATATINNYNQDIDPVTHEYVKGITNVTGKSNSKIISNNYGGMGEIHTGAYSENEIWILNDKAYVNWLETGLNNDTKVSGANHIYRSDGDGKTEYQYFKGKTTIWVDSSNSILIKQLEDQGWSSNPPETDYGCGSITVNGTKIPIYLPKYSNGTNSNFVDDGWVTLDDKILRQLYRDTNWYNLIADIGSVHGEELAAVKLPLKDVIRVNGSNSGIVDNVGTYQNPYLALIMLASEVVGSYDANITNYYFTVTMQQKGDNFRAILQLESSKNPMQANAGQSYYHLDASNLMEPGRVFFVQALRDELNDMGYGDYIKGDKKTNIYITMDELHKNDASMGYVSLNNGNLVFTPKLYKEDDMKVVNNTQFFGICTGHEDRLDVRKDLEKSAYLSDYGINC